MSENECKIQICSNCDNTYAGSRCAMCYCYSCGVLKDYGHEVYCDECSEMIMDILYPPDCYDD